MARTKDPVAHAQRRDVFLDATARLLRDKGYDTMTIADVIELAGTSKGAFYHYFDSKQSLLDALLNRLIDQAEATMAPVATDGSLDAMSKLDGVFTLITAWKRQRRDLLLEVGRAWYHDGNAMARARLHTAATAMLGRTLTDIVRQGRDEGVFDIGDPEVTARIVLLTMIDLNEQVMPWFIAPVRDENWLPEVKAVLSAYNPVLERLLGLPHNGFTLLDDSALDDWLPR